MIDIHIQKMLHGSSGAMELTVDCSINAGDFVALTGQSGSGKTTLLRTLAGLESATGSLHVNGETWQDATTFLPPQKRRIGFVFQEYALFPNMNVKQNLLYVAKDTALATKLLAMTHLEELQERLPNTLSGGQQQRVSLCRAMMNRPKLLLLDEPLSALDPLMRIKLQHDILSLHQEFGTTTLMVSHDPSEIYRLSNRVIVLENGKIIKDGAAKEVLLKTSGSQKFSFEGELLEIKKVDVIYIAIISIGQQLVEVVVSANEAKALQVGNKVSVSTKAFNPIITSH